VRACLEALHAGRLGHGVRAVEDRRLLDRIVERGVALEVCPTSNVALGVYPDLASVPVPELLASGAAVALGADDPLLFGSRLAAQYEAVRSTHGLDDETLACLAAMSVRASCAPADRKAAMLAGIRGWLDEPG
jgi:adenosine deaminase